MQSNNAMFKENVITSERLDTHYCQVQGLKKFAYFYHPPVILFRGTTLLNIVIWQQVRNDFKVYVSLKKNRLASFGNSQNSFQLPDLVNDFWENVLCYAMAYTFLYHGGVCKYQESRVSYSKHTEVFEREIQPHEMVIEPPVMIFNQW